MDYAGILDFDSPSHSCKHCDAVGIECPACDGEGILAEMGEMARCKLCQAEGVLFVRFEEHEESQ
jgi:primosomal protein N'